MKKNIFELLADLLKSESKYVAEDGKLLKASVYSDIMTMDTNLLSLLLTNEDIKKNFFKNINGTLVFDKQKFAWFIESKEFLPDSYTRFTNKIGLTHNGDFISKSNDVVLDFPYKDCVLEGGQDKDDQKRKEIFYNEIIANDEINRMLAPKAFTNYKRYTKEGVEENITFNENDNLIIKGNNLIVLASLLKKYEGKVKCIYIDPPYNTGNDSFNYNDNFNHSTWLTFMKNRLELAKKLLSDDGVIFIQCDDNEQAYLKVLMDDVFGRENFVNQISVKLKNIAGASGGGEDKRLKKNLEYLLVYSKTYEQLSKFNAVYDERELYSHIQFCKDNNISWKYNSVLVNSGDKKLIATTVDGSGNEIKIYERSDYEIKSIKQIANENNISEKDVYYNYFNSIFRTTIPQSSIRVRVMEKLKEMDLNPYLISIEYIPKSGRNKGVIYEQYYNGDKLNLFAWLLDVVNKKDDKLFKREQIGTLWDFTFAMTNLTKEGNVKFESGKKPEQLLKRIFDMATKENDLVLDFHLGSGTTCAVAHKMGRRYIGVEQMDYIEDITVERMKKVIDGEQGGISKTVNWQGGGSFVYCELLEDAQSLIEKVQNATEEKISEIKEIIYSDNRIVPYITKYELKSVDEEFENLSLEEKKLALIKLIDKNKLYVNYSDIEDSNFNVSERDKSFTKSFYKEV